MTVQTTHTKAITASRVTGTAVYNAAGESIGHVEDVVLDKTSDKILFAVLGFGGFLGIGEKFHAMPWSMLDYSDEKGGYVVNIDTSVLKAAPVYDINELTRNDGVTASSATYYAPYLR